MVNDSFELLETILYIPNTGRRLETKEEKERKANHEAIRNRLLSLGAAFK